MSKSTPTSAAQEQSRLVIVHTPTLDLTTFSNEAFSESASSEHSRKSATAWATLTGSTANQNISEAVGHAFKGIADEQKNMGRISSAIKAHQAQKWSKAFKGYEWAITFLGFVEHNWNYAAQELAKITIPQEENPRLSLWDRFKQLFQRRTKLDEDGDDEESTPAPLDAETKRNCVALTLHALEQRARLFAWSYQLVQAQMLCYRQQIAQQERTTNRL